MLEFNQQLLHNLYLAIRVQLQMEEHVQYLSSDTAV